MASPTAASASPFLALPFELRDQIYRLCVPLNLIFHLECPLYDQNRPEGWIPPSWHDPKSTKKLKNTYFSFDANKPCSHHHGWAPVHHSTICRKGRRRPSRMKFIFNPFALENPQVSDYTSNSSDTCQKCNQYLPRVPPHSRSALPGLLLICKQITDEVEAMLYGGNMFVASATRRGGLQPFNKQRRIKMKQLRIEMARFDVTTNSLDDTSQQFWRDTLKTLRRLEIHVESRPLQLIPGLPVEHEDLRRIAFLDMVQEAVPLEAKIVVDTNDNEEMRQVVEMQMPGRCEFRQLPKRKITFPPFLPSVYDLSFRSSFYRDDDDESGG